ncbi:LysM peptidoglycan-binding domain-containing protein [Pediococcus stilesii]|uniref:LysM domain-containing protein n=1 Tax=Pediococcus stilesii TaxID=331679 RepID=A0A0R2KTJ3_9LACO|nr:LysM peptidoglycan-binding domain-containing protein [Pediococcus stilesii]KRN92754.1 hypothetical protein IV81_GL001138 [Pediococcus stilesii]
MNKKRIAGAALASALLFAPLSVQTVTAMADSFYTNQTNAERADITNWVANTTQEISNNISSQHIDTNNLHGDKYVIQWGDTLSGISSATGISVAKLAYDNHIQNIDLIYAGDILILNRDGEVPTSWHYYGAGVFVAKTKVTINNFIDNSQTTVNINVSPVEKESSSSSHSSSSDGTKDDPNSDFVANDTKSSKAADSKSDDKTAKSNDKKAASETSEMDESEFSDAVKDEVSDGLDLDSDKLNIDFTAKDDANSGSEEESSSEEVNTDEDSSSSSETKDVYSSDQSVSTGSDKFTEKNAKALADKIVKQLKEDDKAGDIEKADEVELTITADGDDFKFNVTLTTENDSDQDSDSNSEDSDSSSSDEESDSESSSEDTNDDESSSESESDQDTAEDQDSSSTENASSDENSNDQANTNSATETDSEE